MNTYQGKTKNNYVVGRVRPDHDITKKHKYYIVVVSPNESLFQTLVKTLQNFSLNGKGIQVVKTANLMEAQALAQQFHDLVLVVIDDAVQVNGSYKVFVDFMVNEIDNRNCKIAFISELMQNNPESGIDLNMQENDEDTRFLYARERLIDITRMVLLTSDMENKITGNSEHAVKISAIDKPSPNPSLPITRDKLYTVLAHDLKEPVGNIKVMLDFLTNEPDLLDQQTSKDLLQRVRESADNVHELLEDFLFWSRMFKQEIYFSPSRVQMEQVIRENTVLMKSVAATKNIKLEIASTTLGVEAFADEYMITTVVRNLLYNAIKFTPDDGLIKLCARKEGGMIVVEVQDNGIGISKENLKKLFRSDMYLSTDGTSHEKGSGLGLILCKDFIDKNGGRLIVKSNAGQGSTFSFTLPAWNFTNLT